MINPKKHLSQWGPIDSNILYPSFWFYPSGPGLKKKYDITWPRLLAWFEDYRLTFWWETDEMQEKGKIAIEKWLVPNIKFKKLRKDYAGFGPRIRKLELEIKSVDDDTSKVSVDKLVTKTYKHLTDYWLTCLVFEVANYGAPDYLQAKLSHFVPSQEMSHALEVLLAPPKLSFHQQEELDLLQKYIKSTSSSLAALLAAHAKKWYWVDNNYFECKNLTAKDFGIRLKGVSKPLAKKKIAAINAYGKKLQAEKQALIKKYKLSNKLSLLAEKLAFSIWWQDERKGQIWHDLSLLEVLLKRTSKDYKIPLAKVQLYFAEEWRDLHVKRKRLPDSVLQQRMKGTFIFVSPKEFTITSGTKAKKAIAPFLFSKREENVKSFSGVVASKGKGNVHGRVKVVLSARSGKHFQKGDILVAPMTEPDYVPLMRKAKAVITDVGGLMSHGAVISREIGIPCIAGTKIATQVLKDGDMVEVDVKTGVVRKL